MVIVDNDCARLDRPVAIGGSGRTDGFISRAIEPISYCVSEVRNFVQYSESAKLTGKKCKSLQRHSVASYNARVLDEDIVLDFRREFARLSPESLVAQGALYFKNYSPPQRSMSVAE